MKEGLPNKDRNAPKLNFIGNVLDKAKDKIVADLTNAAINEIMVDIKKLKKE